MSRRLMLKNESIDGIPIGVNLIIPESCTVGKYVAGKGREGTKDSLGGSGTYCASNFIPFNSNYTYSATGLASAGAAGGCAFDSEGYIRGHIKVTTGSAIKSRVLEIENETGYTITRIRLTINGKDATVASFIRTA